MTGCIEGINGGVWRGLMTGCVEGINDGVYGGD